MQSDETQVALFALVYRTLWREHIDCPLALHDFAEEEPGGLSWCILLALDLLAEDDWRIVERLINGVPHVVVARGLRLSDPFRAEVVLHSKSPNGIRSVRSWAEPFVAKWDHVRAAITRFENEGVAMSRDDIELVASGAWQQVTGGDREAWEEACHEALAWHEFVETSA
jgi:hypothetical protein